MKVFAVKFLEVFSNDKIADEKWNWKPANPNVQEIYASGKATSTRESTYAAEKDDRADTDRPNEGMLFAA